jgi:hypothetical protein
VVCRTTAAHLLASTLLPMSAVARYGVPPSRYRTVAADPKIPVPVRNRPDTTGGGVGGVPASLAPSAP